MKRVGDLTNRRLGHLVALRRDEFIPRKWVCKCDCGKECCVEGRKLNSGVRSSCGCRGFENIVGKRFGYLTVLGLKEIHNQKTFFECLCDCGKITVVGRCKLLDSHTRSCGCLYTQTRESERKAFGASAARKTVRQYERNAVARNLVFGLTNEEATDILKKDCWYCGSPPQREVRLATGYGYFMCNGIDRLNNDLGYLKDNIVPACKKCNERKKADSVDEFLHWVERIAKYRLGLK
jgi:hypothetical protein